MAENIITMTFKTPESIREWLEIQSAANHRSMSGEINSILEAAKNAGQSA